MDNSEEYLILDAAKGIGYAFIQNLINKNIAFTLLEDRARNMVLTDKVCEGKKFLFMSYDSFHDMDDPARQETLEMVIKTCTKKNIRIIYCARIFDDWLYSKSLIRFTIEEMLLDATVNHGARVTTVRISSCWGPNMSDRVLQQIFRDAINGRKLWYPLHSDLPCQFVYLEDAAEVIYRLTRLNNKHPWQVYNYGGATYTTAKSFLHRISGIAGYSKGVGTMRKWQIAIRSLVNDRMKELHKRMHFYRVSYLLDNTIINHLFSDFKPFPIDKAIEDTLAWYKNNL